MIDGQTHTLPGAGPSARAAKRARSTDQSWLITRRDDLRYLWPPGSC